MKTLILSLGRSGSSYLGNLLKFYAADNAMHLMEPFSSSNMPLYDDHYVKTIIEQCSNRSIVLKTHLNQFSLLKKEHQDFFLNTNEWFVIYNLRKNIFLCALSHPVADKLNNFNDRPYETVNICLDETAFNNMIDSKLLMWEKFSRLKKDSAYHKIVYYEDLTFVHAEDIKKIAITYSKITDNYITIKTPYEKIHIENKDNLKEICYNKIKNYQYDGIINNNGIFELE